MRTLIILGHHDKNSFTAKLADAYQNGAEEKGEDVKRLNLIDLKFDPILRTSRRRTQYLETDLVEAQQLIKWANHLVFVFPVWWSAPPALLKGFIDRVFISGFAFKHRENSTGWDKLLTGRSARLIMSSDMSVAMLYLMFFHPALNMMKKATLEYCGISPVSVSSFGSLKESKASKREKMLYEAYRAGLSDN